MIPQNLIVILCLVACKPTADKLSGSTEQPIPIELNMSQQSTTSDSVHFQLTNKGKQDYYVTMINTSYNWLFFFTEDEKKYELFHWADQIPEKVKPGASRSWDVNVKSILKYHGIQDQKNIRLVWSVYGVESAPFILHKSD